MLAIPSAIRSQRGDASRGSMANDTESARSEAT
jgi:hypothetical protein